MTTTETLLIALTMIFALPWALWRVLGGSVLVPLVVVQIVAGVIMGPAMLGAAFPGYYAAIFRPEVLQALNGIAWWSVMLFVFLAGLELDLSDAWVNRRETMVTAGLALGVPLALGSLAAWYLVGQGGWVGPAGNTAQAILGIGMAAAVTALPILVLFLGQLGILRAGLGQRVLRYASLDDLLIWSVLAVILLDWDRLARQVGFALVFLTLAPVMRRLIPRLREQDRGPLAVIWLLLCSFTADWAGLHYMVGAFLAGAVLEARWFGLAHVDAARAVVLMAFMPVYFLSTGLRTSWDIGGLAVLAGAGLLLVAAVGGKLIGVHIAGRILGWPKGEATTIGWLLQTKALIMIVFISILLDKAIITAASFTALILMGIASTLLTMPIVTRRLNPRL